MGKLENRVALVTGATSGIGKGITKVFLQEGAKVVFCGRRETQGKAIEQELREQGYETSFIKADVSKEEDIKKIVQFTVDTYGQLDILVNNAGIMYTVAIDEMTAEQIDNTFDLNIKGYMLSAKYAVPHMKSGASIINIGSAGGMVAGHLSTAYGASKAAVIHFSRVLARELAPKNIRVNSISPGTFVTEMMPADSEYTKFCAEACPMGRVGQPEELGNVAAFLASSESSYMTGTNLLVDGGSIS